jgi:hypothetical protein
VLRQYALLLGVLDVCTNKAARWRRPVNGRRNRAARTLWRTGVGVAFFGTDVSKVRMEDQGAAFVVTPLAVEKQYWGELTEEGKALLAQKDCPIRKEHRIAEWPAPKHHVAPIEEEEQPQQQAAEPESKRGKKKWGKKGKQEGGGGNKKKNPWLGGRPGMVPRLGPQLCQVSDRRTKDRGLSLT